MVKVWLFFFSILGVSLFAQETDIISKIKTADSLYDKGVFKKAYEIRSQIIASLADDNPQLATQNYQLKLTEYQLSTSNDVSLKAILEALEAFKEIKDPDSVAQFDLYNLVYHAYGYNNKWKESLRYAKQSLEYIKGKEKRIGDKKIADLFYDIGYMYNEIEDYYNAIDFYLKAEQAYKKLQPYKTSDLALVYNNLGEAYSSISQSEKKLDYYHKAMQIWEQDPKNQFANLKSVYGNLIFSYWIYGDAQKSSFYLNKLKTLLKSAQNISKDEAVLNEVIFLFYQLKSCEMQEDEKCLNQSLTNMEKLVYANPHIEELNKYLTNSFDTPSNFLRKNKRFQEAIDNCQRGLRFVEKVGYEYGKIILNASLGVTYREMGQPEKALHYFDEALKATSLKFPINRAALLLNKALVMEKMEGENPEPLFKEAGSIYLNENLNSENALSQLIEVARFYLEKYQKKKNKNDLGEAEKYYENAINIFKSVYQKGEFNDVLAEMQSRLYDGLLQLAIFNKDKRGEYLEAIENTGSQFLWANYLRKSAPKELKEPLGLVNQIQAIEEKISFYAERLAKGQATDGDKNEKIALEVSLERLQQQLQQDYANFFGFSNKRFNLVDFTHAIDEKAILRYIVTQKHVFAISINNASVEVALLKDTDTLKNLVNTYTQKIKTLDKNLNALSTKLYGLLIEPALKDVEAGKQLLIVPDGFLNYLPYETLRDASGTYVLQNHSIGYATSLPLYQLQQNKDEPKNNRIAVFAPQYKEASLTSVGERQGLLKLENTKEEATLVSSFFTGEVFTDPTNMKQQFLSDASSYTMLHMAMHAIIEDGEETSNLVFSLEDRLYLSQLYGMELPSSLVVLSACNTGSGNLKDGEGVISLSRAFTYAGVAATVTSLWQVPDKQTKQLMGYFYENLKEGLNKADALSKAKLDYIKNTKNAELRHPYYWAGFVLNGSSQPLPKAPTLWYFMLGAFVGLVAITALVKFFKEP